MAKGPKLHYAWKEGQTYVYRVRIAAERGDFKEDYTGDVTYTVKSARNNETQLNMSGTVSGTERGESLNVVILSRHHVAFSRHTRTVPAISITVDDLGRVVQSDDGPRLPYLLGDLAQFVIEPLSAAGEDSWAVSTDTGGSLVGTWHPYYRYRQAGFNDGLAANERTTYTIEGTNGKLTTIAKHFELATIAVVLGKPRVDATGDGKLTFNNARGVVGSLEFTMRVTARDKNRAEEIPLKVSYRLLDEEEVAKIAKDAENARSEKERPLTEKEITAAIADLNRVITKESRVPPSSWRKNRPAPNAKAAKALESVMLNGDNAIDRSNAAKAMKAWSSQDDVAALISALNDSWPPVRADAIEALTKFKPVSAIVPVSQRLLDMQNRDAAAKFLKAMGPVAESAVLIHMDNSDPWVRKEACEILKVIGTKNCTSALKKATKDSNWLVTKPAEERWRPSNYASKCR